MYYNSDMKKILVTGGAGYIGSHTCVELLNANYEVIIVDNLDNSKKESLKRVAKITGKNPIFYQTDIRNLNKMHKILKKHRPTAVIHFAALKAVGESVEKPLRYYDNNIIGTIQLLKILKEHHINHFVFSSSATVYGMPKTVPVTEDMPNFAVNPYGRTKLMMEEILQDQTIADPNFSVALLRYFNPIGAHPSGDIGEDPSGIPNNLFPYITQVAVGKLKQLTVFGNDYPTKDGTGIRDYIHVVDLAKGHLKALQFLENTTGAHIFNLGTGNGYSVLDIINTFEAINKIKIPYIFTKRRAGDVASCYSDPSKAKKILNWQTELTLEDMCRDGWKWQQKNPNGY